MTDIQFFYCYDGLMMRKLQDKGIRYVTRALTVDKLQKFWLYVITPELQKAISEIKVDKLLD